MTIVALRRVVECLDGRRVPLNREERSERPGAFPYWGANGVVDHVDEPIFDEELVLLGEDGAPFGDPLKDVAFHVTEPVWVNNHIHVLRPVGVNPRFLTYALNSVDWPRYISGSTREKLTQDDMMAAALHLPCVELQGRIAAFLDAETQRVEQLIDAKARTVDLLEERRWMSFVDRLANTGAAPVPIRRVLERITDGPFGSAFSSSEYVESGVAVIRLGNIGFARWRDAELAFIPEDRYAEFERHGVHQDDVLIAGLGDANNHAGRACVAPELGLAIVKGKCFCARADRERADPRFLALFLSSPFGAEAVAVEARGSTRQMINLEIIKNVPIPLPSHRTQVEIVERTESEWVLLEEAKTAIVREIHLLQERRRSVITAAITGEMEVP